MSNKQNDEIIDAIVDIRGLAKLIMVVRDICGRGLDYEDMKELSDWLLAHDLEMLKYYEKDVLKSINKTFDKGIKP